MQKWIARDQSYMYPYQYVHRRILKPCKKYRSYAKLLTMKIADPKVYSPCASVRKSKRRSLQKVESKQKLYYGYVLAVTIAKPRACFASVRKSTCQSDAHGSRSYFCLYQNYAAEVWNDLTSLVEYYLPRCSLISSYSLWKLLIRKCSRLAPAFASTNADWAFLFPIKRR